MIARLAELRSPLAHSKKDPFVPGEVGRSKAFYLDNNRVISYS